LPPLQPWKIAGFYGQRFLDMMAASKRKENSMSRKLGLFASVWAPLSALLILLAIPGLAQQPEFRPAIVGNPMSDFTLPAYQGGEVTLSKLQGKNVMIVFPRGYAAEGYWCTICDYKYAELVDLEAREQIRKTYNMEILYVFPYSRETIKLWLDAVPDQLAKIHTWKYPPEPDKLDEKGRARMERSRQGFPKDLSMEKGKVPTPFPILMDEDRKLTRSLGLFMTEWSGGKADQLIPSTYIIDKHSVLEFKYIGQNTWDRPSWDYLKKALDAINALP
jgi:peroxiredoxin